MTEQKKLFLLDGMALVFRAHFAFIRNPRINSKGLNTSAVFGFTNSLLEILEKEKPTHIAIAFDTDKPTFRHEEYVEYKANRDSRPEDITVAIPLVKKLAEAFKIPVLELDGYEADDVIGTIAKRAGREGYQVFMMTPDKDFAQLVEENILLYKPGRMGKPSEVWGIDQVKEKFGISRIDQVVDIQGLMGDSIDNIPGIPGIGPKTAEKLIAEFDNLENLIKNADKLKGKQRENVEKYADQAILSKRLATINIEVPVEFDPKSLKLEEMDKKMVQRLFAELEFKGLGNRLFGDAYQGKEVKKEGGYQQDLFSQIPQMKDSYTETTLKSLKDLDCSYSIIEGPEKLAELVEELKKVKIFSLDTETSGLDPLFSTLVGISISLKPHQGYYIPVPDDDEESKEMIRILKPVLEDPSIKKTGQNIKYEIQVFQNAGVELAGLDFDTMIAHYLIDPESPHGLDYLSQRYLKYSPISIESLIGKKGRNQKSMRDIEPEKIVDYACEDSDLVLQLQDIFVKEMKEKDLMDLFRKVELPLIPVLAGMEREGVKVDKLTLDNYSKELAIEMKELEKAIFSSCKMEFNLNSPKQLGEVLFDQLKLEPKPRKTKKTGQYSTGEDILLKLAPRYEVVEKILDYRSTQKLKSTYVDALPALINKKTGRIHTSYRQAVAATGRLSSNNPNLQNIPIRTEKGRFIRKAFVPRDEDHVLLSADYSQIELRLIAEISGDEIMLQAFRDGLDIHTSTAAKIYDISLESVTPEMRRNAKTVNFGIIYGISAFGLSERLGIPRREAKEIIDNYFERFSGVRTYMEKTIEEAGKKGYVKTLLGRRRYLRDINSRNANQRGFAERNAINAPIQGTAADMIKLAMVNIYQRLAENKMRSSMILQVHDELVFDARKDELDQLKKIVEHEMKNALPGLKVPVEVDMGSGKDWLEAH